MCGDYGMTDRKPKSHPSVLGGVEGIEYPLELIGIDAVAAIENGNANGTFIVGKTGHHFDTPIARRIAAHRFGGVEKKVQNDLLQLDAVAPPLGKVIIDPRVDLNVALLELAARQRQDVAQQIADLQMLKLGFAPHQQRAQTLDD